MPSTWLVSRLQPSLPLSLSLILRCLSLVSLLCFCSVVATWSCIMLSFQANNNVFLRVQDACPASMRRRFSLWRRRLSFSLCFSTWILQNPPSTRARTEHLWSLQQQRLHALPLVCRSPAPEPGRRLPRVGAHYHWRGYSLRDF